MSDITVTFGGREVVLKPCGDRVWQTDNLRLIEYGTRTFKAFREPFPVQGWGITPQAAVSAVESNLRSLASEIRGVLGELPTASQS
jgi:hypothetical protein